MANCLGPSTRDQCQNILIYSWSQRSWQIIYQFLEWKQDPYFKIEIMHEPDTLVQALGGVEKELRHTVPCSGPELQTGGCKATCEYIQDAYKYWQLGPHPAADRVTYGHILSAMWHQSHIKERNHPVQGRRSWFLIIIQEIHNNCENYYIMWVALSIAHFQVGYEDSQVPFYS